MFVSGCRLNGNDGPSLFQFGSSPKAGPDAGYQCPHQRRIANKSDKKSNKELYNLMTDPRVRRGSYVVDLGPKIIGTEGGPHYPCFEMVKKDPLCQLYLRGLKKCSDTGTQGIPITPKKFKSPKKKIKHDKPIIQSQFLGKSNSECQTEVYFEVLDEGAEQIVNSTQTDVVTDLDFTFLGRAMIRNQKVGDDKETQILPGDLFYFNDQVAPIVNSVASAVVEQALLELMMESELEALLAQQRAYENKRNVELVRLQRLQKRQQDLVSENMRQIQTEKENMEQAMVAGKMVSLGLFAKHFLNDIVQTAMDAARRDGTLTSEVEAGHDADPIMTWIEKETEQSQRKNIIAREILDDIIMNSAVMSVMQPMLYSMSPEFSDFEE